MDAEQLKLIVTEEQKLEANSFYTEAMEVLSESGAEYMLRYLRSRFVRNQD